MLLTAQLALTLVADNNSQRAPSAAAASAAANKGIVGTLYRSAAIKAEPEKDNSLTQAARGQRCVRCGTAGYYGGNNGYVADRFVNCTREHSSEIPFKSIRKHKHSVCGLNIPFQVIQFFISVNEAY